MKRDPRDFIGPSGRSGFRKREASTSSLVHLRQEFLQFFDFGQKLIGGILKLFGKEVQPLA